MNAPLFEIGLTVRAQRDLRDILDIMKRLVLMPLLKKIMIN